MDSSFEKLTRHNLRNLGLSDYTIRELVKGLDSISTNCRQKEYSASDIEASIERRLKNPKIKPEGKEKLQRSLNRLRGESNVIEVDFLKESLPAQRLALLESRGRELKNQESSLLEETEEILMQAKRIAANK